MRKFVKFVIGLFLMAVSPSFRALVRAKMRGANDVAHNREEIVAVMETHGSKEYIT